MSGRSSSRLISTGLIKTEVVLKLFSSRILSTTSFCLIKTEVVLKFTILFWGRTERLGLIKTEVVLK